VCEKNLKVLLSFEEADKELLQAEFTNTNVMKEGYLW
jgi:hypothetical protein